jgi:hypothetical protein
VTRRRSTIATSVHATIGLRPFDAPRSRTLAKQREVDRGRLSILSNDGGEACWRDVVFGCQLLEPVTYILEAPTRPPAEGRDESCGLVVALELFAAFWQLRVPLDGRALRFEQLLQH